MGGTKKGKEKTKKGKGGSRWRLRGARDGRENELGGMGEGDHGTWRERWKRMWDCLLRQGWVRERRRGKEKAKQEAEEDERGSSAAEKGEGVDGRGG